MGRDPFDEGAEEDLPDIDDRLAPPETRVEYLHGRELYAAPADDPHATRHADLAYVLGAHARKEYRGAVDMLTRTGPGSDFAPDASVFRYDPHTGKRQLDELAFEITSKQRLGVPTEKARELVARGVRRVFCILADKSRLLEWSKDIDGWKTLPKNSEISDPVLVRPIPVAALLDAASTDDAVARALLDRGVPALDDALAARAAEGKADGMLEGTRTALLAVLAARGLALTPAQKKKIRACSDPQLLAKWIERAATATRTTEIWSRAPARKPPARRARGSR